jgi:hypothetical protein
MAVLALAMPVFAAQAKAAKAKTMTISGTLQKVDGQTLTVQTAKGPEMVLLGSSSQIRRAGKTLTPGDLGSANGTRVTVRYMENNGQKTAQSVTLAAAPKTAAPKAAASKAAAAPTVAKK